MGWSLVARLAQVIVEGTGLVCLVQAVAGMGSDELENAPRSPPHVSPAARCCGLISLSRLSADPI
jgi:hypothetical protein